MLQGWRARRRRQACRRGRLGRWPTADNVIERAAAAGRVIRSRFRNQMIEPAGLGVAFYLRVPRLTAAGIQPRIQLRLLIRPERLDYFCKLCHGVAHDSQYLVLRGHDLPRERSQPFSHRRHASG